MSNQPMSKRKSPLHEAIDNSNLEEVKKYLENENSTMIIGRESEIIKYILDRRLKVVDQESNADHINNQDSETIEDASSPEKDTPSPEKDTPSPEKDTPSKNSYIFKEVFSRFKDKVQSKAINGWDENGTPLLFQVLDAGKDYLTVLNESKNVNWDVRDKKGNNLLHYALSSPTISEEALDFLNQKFSNNQNFLAINNDCENVLHCAAKSKNPQNFKWCLDNLKGDNNEISGLLNGINIYGETPVIQLLKTEDLNKDQKNNQDFEYIVQFLDENKYDFLKTDYGEQNAISLIVKNDHDTTLIKDREQQYKDEVTFSAIENNKPSPLGKISNQNRIDCIEKFTAKHPKRSADFIPELLEKKRDQSLVQEDTQKENQVNHQINELFLSHVGLYEKEGILATLSDLLMERDEDNTKKPIIYCGNKEEEKGSLSNKLREISETRDVFYIRNIGNHWVLLYCFKGEDNNHNLLAVDPFGGVGNFQDIFSDFKGNKYISNTKIQHDTNSCGPITAEVTRALYSNLGKIKKLGKTPIHNSDISSIDITSILPKGLIDDAKDFQFSKFRNCHVKIATAIDQEFGNMPLQLIMGRFLGDNQNSNLDRIEDVMAGKECFVSAKGVKQIFYHSDRVKEIQNTKQILEDKVGGNAQLKDIIEKKGYIALSSKDFKEIKDQLGSWYADVKIEDCCELSDTIGDKELEKIKQIRKEFELDLRGEFKKSVSPARNDILLDNFLRLASTDKIRDFLDEHKHTAKPKVNLDDKILKEAFAAARSGDLERLKVFVDYYGDDVKNSVLYKTDIGDASLIEAAAEKAQSRVVQYIISKHNEIYERLKQDNEKSEFMEKSSKSFIAHIDKRDDLWAKGLTKVLQDKTPDISMIEKILVPKRSNEEKPENRNDYGNLQYYANIIKRGDIEKFKAVLENIKPESKVFSTLSHDDEGHNLITLTATLGTIDHWKEIERVYQKVAQRSTLKASLDGKSTVGSPIQAALIANNLQMFNHFFDSQDGLKINKQYGAKQNNILHTILQLNKVELFNDIFFRFKNKKEFIEALQQSNSEDKSPLSLALEKGNYAIFNQVISNNKENIKNLLIKDNFRLVESAVEFGNEAILEQIFNLQDKYKLNLLNHNHKRNKRGEYKESGLLNIACKHGNIKAASYIIEKLEEQKLARKRVLVRALNASISTGTYNKEIFDLFFSLDIKSGHFDNIQNENSPVHNAAKTGNIDALRYLINEFPNGILNVQDKKGKTPLHNALENNHKEIVEFLIKNGANLDLPDKGNVTPFELALKNNKFSDICFKLLTDDSKFNETQKTELLSKSGFLNTIFKNTNNADQKSEVNKAIQLWVNKHPSLLGVVNQDSTLLYDIISRDEHDLFGKIKDKIDLNLITKKTSNKLEETPLHAAVRNGNVATVEALLEALPQNDLFKAVNNYNAEGYTSFQIAARSDKKEVYELLAKYGDVRSKTKNGDSIEYLLALSDIDTAKKLFEGKKYTEKDAVKFLSDAFSAGSFDIVKTIFKSLREDKSLQAKNEIIKTFGRKSPNAFKNLPVSKFIKVNHLQEEKILSETFKKLDGANNIDQLCKFLTNNWYDEGYGEEQKLNSIDLFPLIEEEIRVSQGRKNIIDVQTKLLKEIDNETLSYDLKETPKDVLYTSCRDLEGKSIIDFAFTKNNVDFIKAILNNKTLWDPRFVDSEGNTLLHKLVQLDDSDLIKNNINELIGKGFSVLQKNNKGESVKDIIEDVNFTYEDQLKFLSPREEEFKEHFEKALNSLLVNSSVSDLEKISEYKDYSKYYGTLFNPFHRVVSACFKCDLSNDYIFNDQIRNFTKLLKSNGLRSALDKTDEARGNFLHKALNEAAASTNSYDNTVKMLDGILFSVIDTLHQSSNFVLRDKLFFEQRNDEGDNVIEALAKVPGSLAIFEKLEKEFSKDKFAQECDLNLVLVNAASGKNGDLFTHIIENYRLNRFRTSNEYGQPPLHAAVVSGDKETVLAVLKSGANINQLNSHGFTPLDILLRSIPSNINKSFNFNLVELLIKHGAYLSKESINTIKSMDESVQKDVLSKIVHSRSEFHNLKHNLLNEVGNFITPKGSGKLIEIDIEVGGSIAYLKIANGKLRSNALLNSNVCKDNNLTTSYFDIDGSKGYIQRSESGKRNYVVSNDSIKVKVWWTPSDTNKKESITVHINSDGTIVVSEKDLKKYDNDKGKLLEEVNFNENEVYVGGIPLKKALESGRWYEKRLEKQAPSRELETVRSNNLSPGNDGHNADLSETAEILQEDSISNENENNEALNVQAVQKTDSKGSNEVYDAVSKLANTISNLISKGINDLELQKGVRDLKKLLEENEFIKQNSEFHKIAAQLGKGLEDLLSAVNEELSKKERSELKNKAIKSIKDVVESLGDALAIALDSPDKYSKNLINELQKRFQAENMGLKKLDTKNISPQTRARLGSLLDNKYLESNETKKTELQVSSNQKVPNIQAQQTKVLINEEKKKFYGAVKEVAKSLQGVMDEVENSSNYKQQKLSNQKLKLDLDFSSIKEFLNGPDSGYGSPINEEEKGEKDSWESEKHENGELIKSGKKYKLINVKEYEPELNPIEVMKNLIQETRSNLTSPKKTKAYFSQEIMAKFLNGLTDEQKLQLKIELKSIGNQFTSEDQNLNTAKTLSFNNNTNKKGTIVR